MHNDADFPLVLDIVYMELGCGRLVFLNDNTNLK